MKNTLGDLNNHLFEQIERLNDEDLDNKQLKKEIERSKAIVMVSGKIIENARLGLDAQKLKVEYAGANVALPEMLDNK